MLGSAQKHLRCTSHQAVCPAPVMILLAWCSCSGPAGNIWMFTIMNGTDKETSCQELVMSRWRRLYRFRQNRP